MQKLLLLISGSLLYCISITAQVNADSLSLAMEIHRNQIKLGKLLSQLEQQTNKKQDASEKAQSSANINSTAADKLSDDPDSRKLARRAKNKASDAKKDSRNARVESQNLDKLHKDIQDLKKKIENNQAKLDKRIKDGRPNSAAIDTIPN
ncbi:hypothetical protein A3860_23765 [Niastella vici]|uniref:SlyB protein n=1 Tax=Niastella vici TaxID=1703345 RepID=A0A1V9FYC7_9BACT|nr:hypothetical protein [Niastella vici]OQP63369.1 hypothetical protein A3860_23765 [Niastella vici]